VETLRKGATHLWDLARDLTLGKFTQLQRNDAKEVQEHAPDDETEPKSRVDCSNYYAAFVKGLEKDEGFRAASGALEQDRIVAVRLQRFVNHHFYLSYLEAKRQANPFISRYTWHVDGRGSITVWMPKYLTGKRRSAWLREHVDNPDPRRPGERRRIQDIIDKHLAIPRFVPFDPWRDAGCPSGFPAPDVQTDRRMRPSFAQYLAREKAVSADLQRPAIRKLGPEKIERLVNVVVPNLVTRERTDEEIALEFDLTKTAHSHFCGSKWHKDKATGNTTIPDLWRNAAELLGQVDVFREVAAEAGVFKAAATIANQNGPAKLRRSYNVR
jgi:hypothetical protein